jgi:protein-S-isoprenylcysteine O-methyltransferase Ste14
VKALELKVPPPVVMLVVAAGMWGLSLAVPSVEVPLLARSIAGGVLACIGGAFSLSGGMLFRRARTTVNPMKPQASSSLVTGGIYRYTRNPMYVGLVFVLLGWATFLASPWTLVGPLACALYLQRFQIEPEERVLGERFGAAYSDYAASVRRWL